ncbi:FxLD family lanthipeptide [Streptomyces sp. SM12]|uniref:FxLD family lanthipeptide n=1 Tax=unclassified Streptomyces TaxID=2593676 RepID=UPI000CD55F19
MTIQFEETVPAAAPAAQRPTEDFGDWDLDVSIVESGPSADRLIQMTDDGCGSTCESACNATCP